MRWLEALERLKAVEKVGDDDDDERVLGGLVEEVLVDEPRSGKPATFTPEQICSIVALACEDPRQSGRPVTHWSTTELADEAIKRGIVEEISARSVGRFLGRGGSQASSDTLLAKQRAEAEPRSLIRKSKLSVSITQRRWSCTKEALT